MSQRTTWAAESSDPGTKNKAFTSVQIFLSPWKITQGNGCGQGAACSEGPSGFSQVVTWKGLFYLYSQSLRTCRQPLRRQAGSRREERRAESKYLSEGTRVLSGDVTLS